VLIECGAAAAVPGSARDRALRHPLVKTRAARTRAKHLYRKLKDLKGAVALPEQRVRESGPQPFFRSGTETAFLHSEGYVPILCFGTNVGTKTELNIACACEAGRRLFPRKNDEIAIALFIAADFIRRNCSPQPAVPETQC